MKTREELREYLKNWKKLRMADPVYRAAHNEYHKEYERRKRLDPNVRNYQSEYKKRIRQQFPERILAQERAAYSRNKKVKSEARKRWGSRNFQKMKVYYRDYLEKHRSRIRVRLRKRDAIRMSTDPNYKLRKLLSRRIGQALKGNAKADSVIGLVGCSMVEYRRHIESQFKPGMSWDNWSANGWHLDHIRPCASFDLTDENQQRQCFHYTNTQPLWAVENYSKGSKIICVHA